MMATDGGFWRRDEYSLLVLHLIRRFRDDLTKSRTADLRRTSHSADATAIYLFDLPDQHNGFATTWSRSA